MINQTLLDSQSILLNDAMQTFVFLGVLIMVFGYIGLKNYSNYLLIGVASIMVSVMCLFIMSIMGFIAL